ncbi:hypothetical protein FISHEDRAFT_66083 [Fistulina hepatica ATCC 64428]|uniref:RRM domain-containing protein n=1 Tax=Fistulina hepatica ATCC 64428 TaxID=1128425 RepID=A0A0D7ABQ3_9AGAR|nr:hypothetical protein FISHEDRAFT_66083 [Fistulina hepatica ATCC 64428]
MIMDKSLDELIASKPKGRRGRRAGAAKAQVLGSGPRRPASSAAKGTAAPASSAQPTDKIIVSNLPTDVNETQIKELFASTVGPLREVTLHYDSNGRSKGVAAVHFSRKGDGSKAFEQYNNRLIDGKRPMKIEIVVDPSRPAPASLVSRVTPASSAANGGAVRGSLRGRRVGRRSGARGKSDRPVKSASDLDAEMEDYTTNTDGTTAATAAAV